MSGYSWAPFFTQSPARWLAYAAILLGEGAIVIGIAHSAPDLLVGARAWIIWLAILALDILLARVMVTHAPRSGTDADG